MTEVNSHGCRHHSEREPRCKDAGRRQTDAARRSRTGRAGLGGRVSRCRSALAACRRPGAGAEVSCGLEAVGRADAALPERRSGRLLGRRGGRQDRRVRDLPESWPSVVSGDVRRPRRAAGDGHRQAVAGRRAETCRGTTRPALVHDPPGRDSSLPARRLPSPSPDADGRDRRPLGAARSEGAAGRQRRRRRVDGRARRELARSRARRRSRVHAPNDAAGRVGLRPEARVRVHRRPRPARRCSPPRTRRPRRSSSGRRSPRRAARRWSIASPRRTIGRSTSDSPRASTSGKRDTSPFAGWPSRRPTTPAGTSSEMAGDAGASGDVAERGRCRACPGCPGDRADLTHRFDRAF